MLPFPMTLSDP